MRQTPTLVAVHLPKTAGTSLRIALREGFGEALREDYADRPLTQAPLRRRLKALAHGLRCAGQRLDAPCVYGHFLPVKYRWCRDVRFALWVRDPVQRVLSRYAHYRRDARDGHRSHEARGLVPGLDLPGFLALDNYRNTLAQYLWAFPLQRFDFIGSVEHFEQDLQRLSRRFLGGRALPALRVNVSAAGDDGRGSMAHDGEAAVRRANAIDVRLHAQAMTLRSEQIARGQ